ncbi:MAG TPA: flavin reductase [Candidatus Excrementavichristensenella intestinipullorum]|nr:flavin reductase [Candidatus Excrementavichristensenella intestinipullorum]
MKIQIGEAFPDYFQPAYPEEFQLFSHFETAAAIPSPLFAITTWKQNGKPNVCFHAWSCFHGDSAAFFAVMGNLYQHTHTYANILREKCFGLNFLPARYYDALVETIHHNQEEQDEFAVGGFSLLQGEDISAPLIQQAFLNLECTLEEVRDLTGSGRTAMITGRVRRVWVEERYGRQMDLRWGPEGFMLLSPPPQNLETGAPGQSGIAALSVQRLD